MNYRFSNTGEKSNTQLIYEEIVRQQKLGILPEKFSSYYLYDFFEFSRSRISSVLSYLERKEVLKAVGSGSPRNVLFFKFVQEKDLNFHSKHKFSKRDIINPSSRKKRKFNFSDYDDTFSRLIPFVEGNPNEAVCTKQKIKNILNEIFEKICEIEKLLEE